MSGEFNDILTIGKLGADTDHRAAVDGLRDAFRDSGSGGSVTVSDTFDAS